MITVKCIIRYLAVLIGMFIVCVIISYDNLIWLVYSAVVAGVISAVLCIASRNNFSVAISADETMLDENHSITLYVHLEKTGFCLIPLIELEVTGGGADESAIGCLLFNSSMEIPVTLDVECCGLTEFYVKTDKVHDFVGAIGFEGSKNDSLTLPVVPSLRRYSMTPRLGKDDGDESNECAVTSISGRPGCEVRAYQDGDSPRSINYKLSAKYGKLLTRTNESGGGRVVRQVIAPRSQCNAARLALGLADHLMKMGITVITRYYDEEYTAAPENIEGLRKWLAIQQFGRDDYIASLKDITLDFCVTENCIFNGRPDDDNVTYAYQEIQVSHQSFDA